MAQYRFSNFISSNSAPNGAHHIGVYNSRGEKVGIIPLGSLDKTKTVQPLYRFGLLSDIHVDTTDYNYSQYLATYPYSDEGEGDFKRALKWLTEVENVDMVCACGDLSQNGTTSEFSMPQNVISEYLPISKNIPFYTCTGNHDVKTAGGNGFGNYFLRSLETTWNGMSDFERSNAFNESFCFTKVTNEKTDHFLFLSMYSYSLGSSASPYLDNDILWLENKLKEWKNDRCFIFTHLFFPDYAGNLGRVNGSGGIYPSGNWLGGTQLTKLTTLLSTYKNAIWFSGHSHWKWDLQKYQGNVTIDRFGNDGAWTIHVPSLALPIDSDGSSRVEKPLETQGGVVYVYEDCIVIRGIDFNINTSQNGSTVQNYSGDTYIRYLPIANYNILTPLAYLGEEGEIVTPPVIVTIDNLLVSTSGNRANNCDQIIRSREENGKTYISVEFTNSNQSCVLTSGDLEATDRYFRVLYDDITVSLKNTTDDSIITVPVSEIDNYLGWLVSYSSTDGSVYTLEKLYDYDYEINEEHTCFKYGEGDTTINALGIQFNTSSKLSNSSNACWIDNYLTADERATLERGTNSAYHIIVEFENLRISSVKSEINSEETIEMYTWEDINGMPVGGEIEVIMANPHKNNGYIIGYNGSSATSSGNGFIDLASMDNAAKECVDNDDLHMIISKKQEVTENTTSTNYNRTFTVTNGNKATITNDFEKITSSIDGYDLYMLTTSAERNTNMECSVLVDFDGMEFPRTVYIKMYVDSTSNETSYFTLNGVQYNYSNNNTLTSLSNFSAVSINGATTSGTVHCRHSQKSTHNYRVYVLVPNNIVETVTETTQILGDEYYTLTSKNGGMSPIGTTDVASWSSTPMKFTLSNATSLASTSDLTVGVDSSNNPNLIRFSNPSNSYLNAGGGLSSLKFATGQGEWSVWCLYKTETSGSENNLYLRKSNFETNTSKKSPSVDTYIQDLPGNYVAVSFDQVSQGFHVVPINLDTTKTATLQVDDLKVYSGVNVTSGSTISLPANVGFYNGNGYTGSDRYQIVTGFQPSTTENTEAKLQFQTSSSYTDGSITIVMKVKVLYS